MSFSFLAVGTPQQAIAQLKAPALHGPDSLGEKVRELVIAELERWPQGANTESVAGALVEASGHRGPDSCMLQLTLRTLWLPHTVTEASNR